MFETMLSSSVLILGISLIRFLLKGKISPKIQYSLWGIVAVRLLLPWFSLSNLVSASFTSPIGASNMTDVIFKLMIADSNWKPLAENLAFGYVYTTEEPASVLVKAAAIDWQLLLLLIWITGFCTLLIWFCTVNWRFNWYLKENRVLYTDSVSDVTSLPVYVVNGLKSPCYFGILGEKAIYITPKIASDKKMLNYVLVHEHCHAKQYDDIWAFIRCGLLCFYWMNPFVWLAAYLSKRDCEMACDEAAVTVLGEEERFAYGRVILDLVVEGIHHSNFFNVTTTMAGKGKDLKERIQILAKRPKTTVMAGILLIGAVFAMIMVTFSKAEKQQKIETVSQEEIEGEKVQARAAQWEEDTLVGTEGLILDYASEKLVIFHDYFGMFFYGLPEDTWMYGMDLSSIGCDRMQGDDALEVQVSEDGETVYLHSVSQEEMYVYKPYTGDLYKREYEKMENPFDSLVSTREVLQNSGENISYDCVKMKNGEYLYLSFEDWKVKNTKVLVGDSEYPVFQWSAPVVPSAELNIDGRTSVLDTGLYETYKGYTYELKQQFPALVEMGMIQEIDVGAEVKIEFSFDQNTGETGILKAEVYADYWLDETGRIRMEMPPVLLESDRIRIEKNRIAFEMPECFSVFLSSKIEPEKVMRGGMVKITFESGNEAVYYLVWKGTWQFSDKSSEKGFFLFSGQKKKKVILEEI